MTDEAMPELPVEPHIVWPDRAITRKPEEYRRIAEELPLDTEHLPTAGGFSILQQEEARVFIDGREPTLYHQIASDVYKKLVFRHDVARRYLNENGSVNRALLHRLHQESVNRFLGMVMHANRTRAGRELTADVMPEEFTASTPAGFYYDDEMYAAHPFMYFDNLPLDAPLVRAYVTVAPEHVPTTPRHFVQICQKLIDTGVPFHGKSIGVFSEDRAESIVLYVGSENAQRTAEMVRAYLSQTNIGEGHIQIALPDRQDGLSWAAEPIQKEHELWGRLTGSTVVASFNGVNAAVIAPYYMLRIAAAHEALGGEDHIHQAQVFRQGAKEALVIIQNTLRPNPKQE